MNLFKRLFFKIIVFFNMLYKVLKRTSEKKTKSDWPKNNLIQATNKTRFIYIPCTKYYVLCTMLHVPRTKYHVLSTKYLRMAGEVPRYFLSRIHILLRIPTSLFFNRRSAFDIRKVTSIKYQDARTEIQDITAWGRRVRD